MFCRAVLHAKTALYTLDTATRPAHWIHDLPVRGCPLYRVSHEDPKCPAQRRCHSVQSHPPLLAIGHFESVRQAQQGSLGPDSLAARARETEGLRRHSCACAALPSEASARVAVVVQLAKRRGRGTGTGRRRYPLAVGRSHGWRQWHPGRATMPWARGRECRHCRLESCEHRSDGFFRSTKVWVGQDSSTPESAANCFERTALGYSENLPEACCALRAQVARPCQRQALHRALASTSPRWLAVAK